jgi:hypothetical protein
VAEAGDNLFEVSAEEWLSAGEPDSPHAEAEGCGGKVDDVLWG